MFSRVEDILTKNPTIPQSRVEDLLVQLMEGLPTDEHIRDLVGSPLKADTVSEMTDDTKIYIYTGSETGYTAGHWYYYNGSSWADGGVYNSAGINTDKTLSVEDKAADGKAVGDELTELKETLNQKFDAIVNVDECANLFNKNDEHVTGYRVETNGTLVEYANTSVYYVPLKGSGDYSLKNARGAYGANAYMVFLYDGSKQYLQRVSGEIDSVDNTITHFTITDAHIAGGAKYIGYTVFNTQIDIAMIVKSDTYPSEYIEYYDTVITFKGEVPVSRVDGLEDYVDAQMDALESSVDDKLASQSASLGTQIYDIASDQYFPSKNLFDKTRDDITSGKYWALDGTLTDSDANTKISHSIYVKPGTYVLDNVVYGSLGVNGAAFAVVDQSGNLVRMNNGTLNDAHSQATVTFTESCLIQFNFRAARQNIVFFGLLSDHDDVYSGAKEKLATVNEASAVFDKINEIVEPSINLFNKNSANNTAGQYWDKTGALKTGTSNLCTSHPIVVKQGTYKFTTSSAFGGNQGAVAILNNNGDFFEVIAGTVENSVCSFSVDRVCYVQFNFAANVKDTIVFAEESAFPESYVAYSKGTLDPDLIDLSGTVDKEDTTFFSHVQSDNLLNLEDSVPAKYFNPTSGNLTDYTTRSIRACYVKLQGAGTYSMKVSKQLYGVNAAKICLYDGTKTYIKTVTGTLGEGSDDYAFPLTLTLSDADASAVYMGVTVEDSRANQIMVVKSETYPSEYEPFSDTWKIPDLTVDHSQIPCYVNPLYRKTAIFDGDSICAPNATKARYADIIAGRNDMTFHNYAISGGTITSEMYTTGGAARHWVSGTVDTMYADYPDADYIIFEGGTNDADLIGSIIGGSTPEKFGSVTDMDFSGNYDAETFCGAVETVIYKAMSYWHSKKIGFIIAMKMGTNVNTYKNRKAYFDKIMEICQKWGVPYLNLWDECPMNPHLLSCYDSSKTAQENIDAGKLYEDGQHPTPLGQQVIAAKIEAWMRTL